jgi:hypothetical protein
MRFLLHKFHVLKSKIDISVTSKQGKESYGGNVKNGKQQLMYLRPSAWKGLNKVNCFHCHRVV